MDRVPPAPGPYRWQPLGDARQARLLVLSPCIVHVELGLERRHNQLVHLDVAPIELDAADAVPDVGLPPHPVHSEIEHLDVPVVVPRKEAPFLVVERIAEPHAPAVANLRRKHAHQGLSSNGHDHARVATAALGLACCPSPGSNAATGASCCRTSQTRTQPSRPQVATSGAPKPLACPPMASWIPARGHPEGFQWARKKKKRTHTRAQVVRVALGGQRAARAQHVLRRPHQRVDDRCVGLCAEDRHGRVLEVPDLELAAKVARGQVPICQGGGAERPTLECCRLLHLGQQLDIRTLQLVHLKSTGAPGVGTCSPSGKGQHSCSNSSRVPATPPRDFQKPLHDG